MSRINTPLDSYGESVLIISDGTSVDLPIRDLYGESWLRHYIPPLPVISRTPAAFSVSCYEGEAPSAQTFEIWNSGSGKMNYSITDDANWLSVSPSSGDSSGEHDSITINFQTAGLDPGTYSATITISDDSGVAADKTISVTLTVLPVDCIFHVKHRGKVFKVQRRDKTFSVKPRGKVFRYRH